MTIFDLFSKRQKRLRGEISDVYKYEEIDQKLRVQIVHIIRDAIGECVRYNETAVSAYEFIHKTLCREYGIFTLKRDAVTDFSAIYDFFLSTTDYEKCLDIIELSFKYINVHVRDHLWRYQQGQGFEIAPDDAVAELNGRFREAGVGYQFESNELIRVDSQFLHSEAVKPVLEILSDNKKYAGANSEFLSAHEHYRHARYKETLVDCLKSFESLMKAICDKRKWTYSKSDTAKALINVCLQNNLVPVYLQTQFSSLRALLESGLPTIRNKEGGHGQGVEVINVPEHMATYVLHLTATNLLFLAECEKRL